MITITFPDGNSKQFPAGVTGVEIANTISTSLSKSAVAINVNNNLQDLTKPITEDSTIEIITTAHEKGIDILRHDTAHILAQAVKELYPNTKIAIGPTINEGFYYDLEPENNFTWEDLEGIEKKMNDIIMRNEDIIPEVWSRDEAIKYFQNIGETYKVEIINAIPSDETVTIYRQGDFIDLCRGPHAPTTGHKKFFKLIKLAGSYWRGDSNNRMLQRIYGTAFGSKKELKEWEKVQNNPRTRMTMMINLADYMAEAEMVKSQISLHFINSC